jgi:hypothetical protein
MNATRISTVSLAVSIMCIVTRPVAAQNPKPPTLLPAHIQSVDQLPQDAVVLWIDGQNLTVYIDSTSNPEDQNKLTTLEIKWEGAEPGFVEENCWECGPVSCDFDVCRADKIALVRSRGFGPVRDFGDLIPDGYMETWNPAESWIFDGSYLTGGTLDKFDPDSPYFGPVIPEPSSLTLIFIGLILLRRRN